MKTAMLRRVRWVYIGLMLILLVQISACGRVDKSKDFAMLHNDRKYEVKLDPPIGVINEYESGFSSTRGLSVVFPTAALNTLQNAGFELTFDPDKITLGKVIEFRWGDGNTMFHLNYYPLVGHKMIEGLLLSYTSSVQGGALQVIFDVLEPRVEGRVKGKILHSILYGGYEGQSGAEPGKKKEVLKLEIFNFPFDTKFKPVKLSKQDGE